MINLIEAQILVGDLHISICRSSLSGRSFSTQRNPPLSSLSGGGGGWVRRGCAKTLTASVVGAEFGKVTEKSFLLIHTFSLSSPDFRVVPELPPQLFPRPQHSPDFCYDGKVLAQLLGCPEGEGELGVLITPV